MNKFGILQGTLLSILLATFAVTGETRDKSKVLEGLNFEYTMPNAKYKVQIQIPIKCDSAKEHKATFGAPIAVAVPEIGVDNEVYLLKLSSLESNRVDRNLTVSKYDNGTLKAINAAADDRSFGILGNVFKIIASVFKYSQFSVTTRGETAQPILSCKQSTVDLLNELKELSAANEADVKSLAALRVDPKNPKVVGAIALSTERLIAMRGQRMVAIKETMSPKGECVLNPKRNETVASCSIEIDFGSLLQRGPDPAEKLSLAVSVINETKPIADPSKPGSGKPIPRTPTSKITEVDKVVLRLPYRAPLKLEASSTSWTLDPQNMPTLLVPQWGDDIALPLDVGLSQKRTIALTISPLGELTSVNWATPARAEKATGDLAGVAEHAVAAKAAAAYGQADAEIAELDREIALLEKKAKLQQLKAQVAAGSIVSSSP